MRRSLAYRYRKLSREWHPTRNGELTPRDVTAKSSKRVWWRCPKGPDHEWQAIIAKRVKSPACPFCTGRRASVTNSLESLFPKVAREWDPDRNGLLTPRDVVAARSKRVWWRCARGHVWQAEIRERTVKGRGCHLCSRGLFE